MRLPFALGLLSLAASAFVACGGIATGEGSSGSSGSSSGSSGSDPCVSSPSGGACVPTTTTPNGRAPKVHRASGTACVATKHVEDPNIPEGGVGPEATCHSNADCTEGRNGRCAGNSHNGYRCSYDACYADSECSGGVCLCGTSNACLVGGCQVDANCGPAGFCSPTLGSCGHYSGPVGYYCRTAEDECVDDEDCGEGGMFGQAGYCAYEKSIGHWKCSKAECAG